MAPDPLPPTRREELHETFKEILESDHVYFQPPSNVTMEYPAIVYNRAKADTKFAGDKPYNVAKRYTVTFISRKPETAVWDKIAELPMCTHSTFFVAQNLNHDVFDIFI